jgi:hypothetical protein
VAADGAVSFDPAATVEAVARRGWFGLGLPR